MKSSIKKTKKLVKSQDMFGHVINLNFNREGTSHKTIFGGIVSIILKVLLMIWVYLNFKKMLLYEDDK